MLTHSQWAEQERKDPEQYLGLNRDVYTVWNEKANFLKVAADLNYFNSSYFLWLDIGAVRHSVIFPPQYKSKMIDLIVEPKS